jgi:hypothetical protein
MLRITILIIIALIANVSAFRVDSDLTTIVHEDNVFTFDAFHCNFMLSSTEITRSHILSSDKSLPATFDVSGYRKCGRGHKSISLFEGVLTMPVVWGRLSDGKIEYSIKKYGDATIIEQVVVRKGNDQQPNPINHGIVSSIMKRGLTDEFSGQTGPAINPPILHDWTSSVMRVIIAIDTNTQEKYGNTRENVMNSIGPVLDIVAQRVWNNFRIDLHFEIYWGDGTQTWDHDWPDTSDSRSSIYVVFADWWGIYRETINKNAFAILIASPFPASGWNNYGAFNLWGQSIGVYWVLGTYIDYLPTLLGNAVGSLLGAIWDDTAGGGGLCQNCQCAGDYIMDVFPTMQTTYSRCSQSNIIHNIEDRRNSDIRLLEYMTDTVCGDDVCARDEVELCPADCRVLPQNTTIEVRVRYDTGEYATTGRAELWLQNSDHGEFEFWNRGNLDGGPIGFSVEYNDPRGLELRIIADNDNIIQTRRRMVLNPIENLLFEIELYRVTFDFQTNTTRSMGVYVCNGIDNPVFLAQDNRKRISRSKQIRDPPSNPDPPVLPISLVVKGADKYYVQAGVLDSGLGIVSEPWTGFIYQTDTILVQQSRVLISVMSGGHQIEGYTVVIGDATQLEEHVRIATVGGISEFYTVYSLDNLYAWVVNEDYVSLAIPMNNGVIEIEICR